MQKLQRRLGGTGQGCSARRRSPRQRSPWEPRDAGATCGDLSYDYVGIGGAIAPDYADLEEVMKRRLAQRAKVLIEALPYIKQYNNKNSRQIRRQRHANEDLKRAVMRHCSSVS